MNLYHPHDLPFHHHERPDCYTALGKALGWKDIWNNTEQEDWAAPVRPCVPEPSKWPAKAKGLDLPGQIDKEVLADETKTLRVLGYSDEEIAEAQKQTLPEGG